MIAHKRNSNVKRILQVNSVGNIYRMVWKICILMLGCKELMSNVYLFILLTSEELRRAYEKKGGLNHRNRVLPSPKKIQEDGRYIMQITVSW